MLPTEWLMGPPLPPKDHFVLFANKCSDSSGRSPAGNALPELGIDQTVRVRVHSGFIRTPGYHLVGLLGTGGPQTFSLESTWDRVIDDSAGYLHLEHRSPPSGVERVQYPRAIVDHNMRSAQC